MADSWNTRDDMLSVAIVAGEASGDASGALLANELRKLEPNISIWGAGGQRMREAGVELVADFSHLGAIGIIESLKMVPRLIVEQSRLKKEFFLRQPDVFVPIDFGAFNVPLAKFVRERGIPTVYFFPPGSWRRRAKNPSKLLAAADRIITPFPWSEEILRDAGADVVFPGHPMLDRVAPTMTRDGLLKQLELSPNARVVGLLPGSRPHEVLNILPALVGAGQHITERLPDIGAYLIPAASDRAAKDIESILARACGDHKSCGVGQKPVFRVVRDLTYDVMAHSDLLITCSGTATLETMILGTPMIIVYRGSKAMKIEYLFRKSILEEFIGMPNIIAGRMICPELLGDEASPEKIADLAVSFLGSPEELERRKQELAAARKTLGEPGGTRRAAEAVLMTARTSSKA